MSLIGRGRPRWRAAAERLPHVRATSSSYSRVGTPANQLSSSAWLRWRQLRMIAHSVSSAMVTNVTHGLRSASRASNVAGSCRLISLDTTSVSSATRSFAATRGLRDVTRTRSPGTHRPPRLNRRSRPARKTPPSRLVVYPARAPARQDFSGVDEAQGRPAYCSCCPWTRRASRPRRGTIVILSRPTRYRAGTPQKRTSPRRQPVTGGGSTCGVDGGHAGAPSLIHDPTTVRRRR